MPGLVKFRTVQPSKVMRDSTSEASGLRCGNPGLAGALDGIAFPVENILAPQDLLAFSLPDYLLKPPGQD